MEQESYRDRWTVLSTILLSIAILQLGAASFLSIWTVASYHYPFFFVDEWTSFRFFVEHGFWPSVLCLHNGHPIMLTNLFYRLLLVVFDGAAEARVLVSTGLAAVSSGLLGLLALRSIPRGGYVDSVALTASYVAVFTLGLWLAMGHMLLWGIGLHDHLVVFGVVMAAWGVVRLLTNDAATNAVGLLLVVFGCLLATWSFGFGIALWGATAWVLFLNRYPARWTFTLLALGGLVFAGTLYFVPSCYTLERHSYQSLEPHLLDVVKLIPALLGGAFVNAFKLTPSDWWLKVAQTIGFLGLTATAYWSFRQRYRESDVSIAGLLTVMWFCIGAAFLITLGRAGRFPLENIGLAPRYTPVSVAFWTAGLGIMVRRGLMLINKRSGFKTIARLIFGLFSVGIASTLLISNYQSSKSYTYARSTMLLNGIRLVISENEVDRLKMAQYFQHNRPNDVVSTLSALEENRWDLYRQGWTRALGKPVDEIIDIDEQRLCKGQVSDLPGRRPEIGRAMRGWTRADDGQTPKVIFVVQEERIIGVGLRTASFWNSTSDRQKQDAGIFESVMGRLLPYRLATLLGFHAEWIGARRNDEHNNSTGKVSYFAVLDSGLACKVEIQLDEPKISLVSGKRREP